MSVNAKVFGDKRLQRRFEKLTDQMQRKVIRPAVSAQATVLRREISHRAPEGEETRLEFYTSRTGKIRTRTLGLKKTIAKRAWSKASKGIIGQIVGPKYPEGAHGHLVEFGHAMVTHDGRMVGFVQPHPFQRPAQDSAGPAMRAKGESVARAKFVSLTQA